MENRIKSYKDLVVWQKAIELVADVYSISKTFPNEEKFGLVNQLNRESSKNYLLFLRISRGSLMEVETLIIISKNLNYINEANFRLLSDKLEEVGKILQGLIKGVQQKINITQNSN
jgi:hypothetical protein